MDSRQLPRDLLIIEIEVKIIAPHRAVGHLSAVEDQPLAVHICDGMLSAYHPLKAAVLPLLPAEALTAVERLLQVEPRDIFKNDSHKYPLSIKIQNKYTISVFNML